MKKKPEPLSSEKYRFLRIESEKESIVLGSPFVYLHDVRLACKFYLRYRNNPELFMKEHPELKCKEFSKWIDDFKMGVIEENYNKWLFKLAFKGVIKEGD